MQVNDIRDRLKNHSNDVAEENRRLNNTCERLQNEVSKEATIKCIVFNVFNV